MVNVRVLLLERQLPRRRTDKCFYDKFGSLALSLF